MTLTYIRLATDRGSLLLPNSMVLTAVIGPPGVFDENPLPVPAPAAPNPEPLPAPDPTGIFGPADPAKGPHTL
jgi:hypothetical protein